MALCLLPGCRRTLQANDWRDQFNDRVVDILALCGNLEAVPQSPGSGGQVGAKVQAERDRWVRQIDEITAWMVDHWQGFALTYLGAAGIRGLLTEYVMVARGVWISGRDLDERVRLLKELTEPVQTIFFASRWRVVAVVGRGEGSAAGTAGKAGGWQTSCRGSGSGGEGRASPGGAVIESFRLDARVVAVRARAGPRLARMAPETGTLGGPGWRRPCLV
jgi:hypothetical protein